MNVILTEDVAGKGKKFEKIKVKDGYGNFLLKSNKAIVATEENISKVNKIIEHNAELEHQAYTNALELKNLIENLTITIPVDVSPRGTLIHTITKNEVIDYLPDEIDIDKHKLEVDSIKSCGNFLVGVKLHPKVKATLFIEVVPKNVK